MDQATLQKVQQSANALQAAGIDASVAGNVVNRQRIGYDTAIHPVAVAFASAKLFSKNKGQKLPQSLQNLEFPNTNPIQINAICAVPMVKFAAFEVGSSIKEAFYSWLLLTTLEVMKGETPIYRLPLINCLPYNVVYDNAGDALTFVHKANAFTALPEPVLVPAGSDASINLVKADELTLVTAASAATNPHFNVGAGGLGTSIITAEGRAFFTRVMIAYQDAQQATVI